MYMDRLDQIGRRILEIETLCDQMNVMSALIDLTKEMAKGNPTPEETDYLQRLCAIFDEEDG